MPLSHDTADTCSSLPAAERNRSSQLKWSLLTEKEFLLGAKKPINPGMRGFCFLSEATRETTTFEFIYLLIFLFLFLNPHRALVAKSNSITTSQLGNKTVFDLYWNQCWYLHDLLEKMCILRCFEKIKNLISYFCLYEV